MNKGKLTKFSFLEKWKSTRSPFETASPSESYCMGSCFLQGNLFAVSRKYRHWQKLSATLEQNLFPRTKKGFSKKSLFYARWSNPVSHPKCFWTNFQSIQISYYWTRIPQICRWWYRMVPLLTTSQFIRLLSVNFIIDISHADQPEDLLKAQLKAAIQKAIHDISKSLRERVLHR